MSEDNKTFPGTRSYCIVQKEKCLKVLEVLKKEVFDSMRSSFWKMIGIMMTLAIVTGGGVFGTYTYFSTKTDEVKKVTHDEVKDLNKQFIEITYEQRDQKKDIQYIKGSIEKQEKVQQTILTEIRNLKK